MICGERSTDETLAPCGRPRGHQGPHRFLRVVWGTDSTPELVMLLEGQVDEDGHLSITSSVVVEKDVS